MTKQEEIRSDEGMGSIELRVDDLCGVLEGHTHLTPQGRDKILVYLHSQDVALKVKCPDCEWSQFVGGESVGMTPCHTCNSTGYIYVPLVEGK